MYDDDYAAGHAAGTAAERERCARICEAMIGTRGPEADEALNDAIAAIRDDAPAE